MMNVDPAEETKIDVIMEENPPHHEAPSEEPKVTKNSTPPPLDTWCMWPKMVQVNNTDVYIIGGND